MTIRDDLNTAAREWFIAVTDATDAQVIDAGAKGPRPAMPYVTTRVTSPGDPLLHGPAERIDGLTAGAIPQATMQERREATISLQGYGADTADWLSQAQIRLDSPDSLLLQRDSSIALLLQTPMTDISALLDLEEERRFSLELRLRHQYADDPAEQIELLDTQIDITLERYPSDPDTLDASFELDENGELT